MFPHKTRSSIVYSPHRTLDSFLDGMDPVCAAFAWTEIRTGARAAAALWRRSADINNEGGPKSMRSWKWPFKSGIQLKVILKTYLLNRASWHKNILKVIVRTVSTQTGSVQSVHCVHRRCGLPHVVRCLVFQQRSASFAQSSLHFSLRNVPWPFQTDVEKYNCGHATASLFSRGILKSDWPTEVH